jgi:pseudouridine kinase
VPTSAARVLVVGGAVLDTKLTTRDAPVLGTSNPGTATSGVGGVGRNIAENLARLGTPTALVAAVGDDPAATSVLERTRAAGVDCSGIVTSAHPTGTYTAVLDPWGDLLVAVSDMRATDAIGVADLSPVADLLADVGLVVADGNLAASVLRWMLDAAADAGLPVVLDPVSVAKAAVVASVLDGRHPVHLVTPNVAELEVLVGARGLDASDDGVARGASMLHDRGVGTVWVRRGARGSVLSVRGPGERHARVHVVRAPAVEVVDVTGAGDASTAGYVHALLGGRDGLDAARYGQVCAALTCASAETVRTDLTGDLVTDRLTPADPHVQELAP